MIVSLLDLSLLDFFDIIFNLYSFFHNWNGLARNMILNSLKMVLLLKSPLQINVMGFSAFKKMRVN